MRLLRVLRSSLCAVVCALAIFYFRAPVAAQALTITAADKATYEEFLKTCSAEIAEMKKFLASKGEPMTDAQLRGFMEPMPAQLRESAREEKVTFVTAVREARAQFTKELNDPNNPDKSVKVLGPTMLCFLNLLERGASGSAPGAAPRPPAPAADPLTAPVLGCVKIDEQPRGWVGFKNVCEFPVSFTYCASKPKRGSPSEVTNCETGKLGLDSIAARGVRAAQINEAETVFWYACRGPRLPSGSKFDGSDLVGTCR